MANIKIDAAGLESLREKAYQVYGLIETLQSDWTSNFEKASTTLNKAFDDAYKNVQSSYDTIAGFKYVINNADAATFGLSLTAVTPKEYDGYGVQLAEGTDQKVTGTPVWLTDGKEQLLSILETDVAAAADKVEDLRAKVFNLVAGLDAMGAAVNAYEADGADLSAAIANYETLDNVSFAEDGVTLTGVNTTVTITNPDGTTTTETLTVSEALNAEVAYTECVTDTMLAAQLLTDQYGAEIDYNKLMTNLNGMSAAEIENGLFTHEFIDHVLPSLEIDEAAAQDAAVQNIADSLGTNTDTIKSLLDKLGESALYGALTGAGAIGVAGALVSPGTMPPGGDGSTPPTDGIEPESPSTPSGSDNPPSGGNNPPSGGNNPSGNDNPSNPTVTPTETATATDTPTETATATDTATDTTTDTSTSTVTTETPLIEPVEEVEIPEVEEIVDEIAVDYDELAREMYEEMSPEELEAQRRAIIDAVNLQFENGDLDGLRAKLLEYGYSGPEVESILADREMLIDAMLVGDANAQIAKNAIKLATDAGVKDFDSAYDDPAKYADLTSGSAKDILANVNSNEKVAASKTQMTEAKTAYEEALGNANESLKSVKEAKTSMDEIAEKYNKEFGEDPTKWSSEAVSEYNEAIKAYNEKALDFKEKNELLTTAKESYTESITAYKETRTAALQEARQTAAAETAAQAPAPAEEVTSIGMDGSTGVGDVAGSPSDGAVSDDPNASIGVEDPMALFNQE